MFKLLPIIFKILTSQRFDNNLNEVPKVSKLKKKFIISQNHNSLTSALSSSPKTAITSTPITGSRVSSDPVLEWATVDA